MFQQGDAAVTKFADMFRNSPFQPMHEHMVKVMACVGLVRPMFEAVRGNDRDKLEALAKDVFKTEHDADIVKDEIRQTIPHTFYLPVYRGDLLGHLKLQDDMADAVEDVAVLLTVKPLVLPADIAEDAMTYVDTVVRVCDMSNALTTRFQRIVETGLRNEAVDDALQQVKDVEKAEWESDRCQYKLSKALFALENAVSPVDIMLWFRVFGELGALANYAESLADRMRRMLTSR